LYQTTRNKATRSYRDYPTQNDAFDGICQLYELHLKQLHPNKKQIEYDVSNLFEYLDGLGDLSCLIYQDSTTSYVPHGKAWIKKKVLNRLKKLSGGNNNNNNNSNNKKKGGRKKRN